MQDRTPSKDQGIVRAAIHPAIGIARVGDAETEFFIGPELTAPLHGTRVSTVTAPAR